MTCLLNLHHPRTGPFPRLVMMCPDSDASQSSQTSDLEQGPPFEDIEQMASQVRRLESLVKSKLKGDDIQSMIQTLKQQIHNIRTPTQELLQTDSSIERIERNRS